jgi:lambda family phage portal protein
VLHLFDPDEVGQIRGMPRLTASIVLLFALDSYDDAELERKRVAALFTAFVRREDPDGNLFEEETRKLEAEGVTSAQVLLEPGKAHVLMPGEDIVTAAPADVGANYEAFQYRQLSRLSASLNLPYSGITGDHSRANYSSERSAQLKIRRGIQREQHGVMVFQFLRPVARWFLDAAVLAGTLKLAGYETDPRPWLKIKWIPPKWEWVDPLKDRQAEVVAVNMGAKSLSDVIEAEGAAPEETFQRIARDQKRMKELGIVLPGSPSEAPPPGGGVSEETKTETKTAAGQTP